MALWRIGRGWSEEAMREYLTTLNTRTVNFVTPLDEMTAENGWTIDGADTHIGTESSGPPEEDGFFLRARQALINYDFSDPRIVVGHFDAETEFIGRNILLELKVLGLRYLSGVRVHSVRDESLADKTIFGFRYDTLDGHIERGFEWFLLTKDHNSGDIHFKIEAHWRLGDFPNWWTRVGFKLIGEHYRETWRHRAPERLKKLSRKPVEKATAPSGELAHRGDKTPKRTESTTDRT